MACKVAQVVKNNDFNQRVMVNAIQLLGVWLPLYNMCHLLNVSKHEVMEIHHLHSSEMHE